MREKTYKRNEAHELPIFLIIIGIVFIMIPYLAVVLALC